MKKVKGYISKNKKLSIFIASSLALIVVIALFVFNRKINVIEEVKPEYTGYNNVGTLTYNEDSVKKSLLKQILKKYGVSDSDIRMILADDGGYAGQLASSGTETGEKIIKADNVLQAVDINFDKTENLSNGEKVKLTIKTPEGSPVKSGEKIFTVSGLKKSESIFAEAYLEDYPLTFEGYNGYGSISDEGVYTIESENITSLSNGDIVKLKIDNSVVESAKDEGIIVKDADKILEQKVTGLKELTSIANIKDVLPKIDEQAKADNKNDTNSKYTHITYNLEKQNNFIKYSYSQWDDTQSLSIVSVYKITKTTTNTEEDFIDPGKTETETYYYVYGYDNLEILDDKLILKDLSIKEHSTGWGNKFENLESQIVELKSNDYIEYKE